MTKVVNYTEEQTQHMIEAYRQDPTRETVEKLATEMGKTAKSIIGKLSREKVYIKREYTTKRGDKPITKAEITQDIADMLNIPGAKIAGLGKASKRDLIALQSAINKVT